MSAAGRAAAPWPYPPIATRLDQEVRLRPCSNCKGQLRDLFTYDDLWKKRSILYDGPSELIVNCMTNVKGPFNGWEMH